MPRSAYDLDSPRADWFDRAACLHYPADWWVLNTSGKLSRDNQTATTICARCPVTVQCAAYALRVGITGMIVAGRPLGLTGNRVRSFAPQTRTCTRCATPFRPADSPYRLYCTTECHAEVRREQLTRSNRRSNRRRVRAT